MKFTYFLLGLIFGLLLTAFATPPTHRPKPQPIRGYRSPVPMARPAQRIMVDNPHSDDFKQDVRDLVEDINAGRVSLKDILIQNKANREKLFNA